MKQGTCRIGNKGRAGCGCLLTTLIIIMIIAGLGFHPVTLKYTAKYFRYEDKIFPADALFVPVFPEDNTGEVYADAFREYFSGNTRMIYVETDRILGNDTGNMVLRMAKERGVKESAIKLIPAGNNAPVTTDTIKKTLKNAGARKIIILVPDYASRRYHAMYPSDNDPSGIVFMIKSLRVSYFRSDKWWRDELSRALLARESYNLLVYYYTVLRKDTTK
ncbi:MAG: SGNH/GDSL hydrolase family protein [Syntrophorhabdaceae bacterium]